MNAIRTERDELSILLSYTVNSEIQNAKVVIPRSKDMAKHPACRLGVDVITGQRRKGTKVIISGILVNAAYNIRGADGQENRGISTGIVVKSLKDVDEEDYTLTFDSLPVTRFASTTKAAGTAIAKKVPQRTRAVVRT